MCGQGAWLVTGMEVPLFLPGRGRLHWQPGLQPSICSPEIESSYTASPTQSPSFSGAPSYTNVAQPSLSRPFPLEIHWPPLSSSKHLGALSQGLWVERFLFLENPCINANFLALLVFFLSFLSTYFISIFIHLFLAVLGLHCCFGFLQLQRLGVILQLWRGGFSLQRPLQLWRVGSGCTGVSGCSMCAQQVWCVDFVARWHMGSSWTGDRTHVSCIGKWIPNHQTMREAPCSYFFKQLSHKSHNLF